MPVDEPIWYYDLHPAMRDLVMRNGHVPLLADVAITREKHLRKVEVLPEFDMRVADRASPREIDLLLMSREYVSVGEAKVTPKFSSNEVKGKLAALSLGVQLVWADELVLAAYAEGVWDHHLVSSCLSDRLRSSPRPDGVVPKIRLITGLRGAAIHQLVD